MLMTQRSKIITDLCDNNTTFFGVWVALLEDAIDTLKQHALTRMRMGHNLPFIRNDFFGKIGTAGSWLVIDVFAGHRKA